MRSSDCGHTCCPIVTNPYHTHTVEPDDCVQCTVATTGEVFAWTDNSDDPCWLCVQWKNSEPVLPTQNPALRIWRGVHIYCQEQLSGLAPRFI